MTGTVTSPALPGVAGLTVQLVDKNVGGDQVAGTTQTGGDQVLGTTQTGSGGQFSFTSLPISLKYLLGHHKTQPDLQAQVLAGGQFLAASPVSYSAPQTVVLNVVLPAGSAGLPSEYETLTANLARPTRAPSARCRRVTARVTSPTWPTRPAGMRAPWPWPRWPTSSARSARLSTPGGGPGPDRRPGRGPTASLQPEFYYALFRAGLPASADSLFQADPGTVQAIWQQATTQGVIPQALATDVPAALQSFQALSAARVLTAAPAAGVSTLEEMLQPTLPEATSSGSSPSCTPSIRATGPASGRRPSSCSGRPRPPSCS